MAEQPKTKRNIKEILKQPQFPAYVILVLLGLYLQVQFLILQKPSYGYFLLILSLGSVITTFMFWRKFIPKTAPKVIIFSVNNFVGQKLISGGNDIYREDSVAHAEIGRFAPFGRVFNILIAFLGIATTLLKTLNAFIPKLSPESPIDDTLSFIGWTFLMFLIPLILTIVTPVIWVMEDLGLKTWNAKKITTWRISDKYRMKFNSFISIGALVSIFSIGKKASFTDNITLFGSLLLNGTSLLLLPMTILTIIYFEKFKAEISNEVLAQVDLPIAKTERIFTYRPSSNEDAEIIDDSATVESTAETSDKDLIIDESLKSEVAELEADDSPSTFSKSADTTKESSVDVIESVDEPSTSEESNDSEISSPAESPESTDVASDDSSELDESEIPASDDSSESDVSENPESDDSSESDESENPESDPTTQKESSENNEGE